MPKRKLPHKKTPEWGALINQYPTSTAQWRQEQAQKYGFDDTHCFMTSMAQAGIKLSLEGTTKTITDYQIPPDSSWSEHLRVIKEMDGLVAFHQKIPTEVSIQYETKLPIALVQSADWQLGQFGVDYDSFQKDIETIVNEPGLYVDIGGDAWQNVIQASKIGSSHNQTPIPVQLGLTVLTLQKLKPKLNVLRTGNHSHWSTSLTGEDWLGEKSKKLKLCYIKHGARINLTVGSQEYPYRAQHIGRYNSSFNLTHSNKQEQRMNYPWARFIVLEHIHIADMEQYRYDGKECVAIRTGTYAVYDDYAQQWGFYGAHVANPTVIMFPDQDKLVGFKDMYDAITYLRAVRKEYEEKLG
jgi:hypothetical protein